MIAQPGSAFKLDEKPVKVGLMEIEIFAFIIKSGEKHAAAGRLEPSGEVEGGLPAQ